MLFGAQKKKKKKKNILYIFSRLHEGKLKEHTVNF
jgi:hypothetical protein